MEGYPLASIPPLGLQEGVKRNDIDIPLIVDDWLSALEEHVTNKESKELSELFIDNSWWRDLVALSWDISTKHGVKDISDYVHDSSAGLTHLTPIRAGSLQPALVDMGGMIWIQAGFKFQTAYGSGTGLVRLANVSKTQWKAWTVFSQLEGLKSQDVLDEQRARESYSQTRVPNGIARVEKEDLTVLIVGAGAWHQRL
jgi:hypothetical protein